jgi:hypothetical protein
MKTCKQLEAQLKQLDAIIAARQTAACALRTSG